mmetsp:Transcript_33190/g.65411  ORF Transcript_33190/g.65411 Transcript_33190/m.65411 type:complete len:95 (-) Transcript_33190:330-614(-)
MPLAAASMPQTGHQQQAAAYYQLQPASHLLTKSKTSTQNVPPSTPKLPIYFVSFGRRLGSSRTRLFSNGSKLNMLFRAQILFRLAPMSSSSFME